MQRSYAQYVTEARIEPTEATGFLLFSVYIFCAEYEFDTFGSTSDQIRLMALIQTLQTFVLNQYIQLLMKLV